jgi:hypothetical protein
VRISSRNIYFRLWLIMYLSVNFLPICSVELDADRAKVGLDISEAFPQATAASKFPPCGK